MYTKDNTLILQRHTPTTNSTVGILLDQKGIISHTLEDEHRDIKVKGETRIWAGIYPLTIRKVDSILTIKYRERYSWFKYHIMLQDVPGFKYIYIHIGNTDKDSDGCILIADTYTVVRTGRQQIYSSATNYKKFYEEYYDKIEAGGMYIWVRDENYMYNYKHTNDSGLWKV
jgi:hypothetical protein